MCIQLIIFFLIVNSNSHQSFVHREDHIILGRVLNDEKSWETYLKYVEEFVGVVESTIADLRAYGHTIKMYLVDDALAAGQSVESYEDSELALDYSDYNTASNPLLKTF